MKWTSFFTDYNIPYYIYKLKKEDAIVLNNLNLKNQSIIIIYGSIYATKIFRNKKTLPLAILKTGNIFHIKHLKHKNLFYYKLIAIEETYILSFEIDKLKNKKKITHNFLFHIINSYNNTIQKYEVMSEIINQKYTKKRLIQLILLLCLEFGIFKDKKVCIPLKMSQKNLSQMISINKNNINQIIKFLNKDTKIYYSKQKKFLINDVFQININKC
uniref:Global nitrogen transcriptional regulator n=1 Tax=Cliftonaea pectinata TaxID=2007206 RepID=A0A1Z1MPT0_9FLOR|nr:global nitrogen transcriptional regulator [Cliftonaea pectinata]ARW68058.1 global nitrogen transcriptional regulator [Cliftonaea pectinata]